MLAGSAASRLFLGDGDGAFQRQTLRYLAGALTLHLLLTAFDAAGIPWSIPGIALGFGALGFLLYRAARPRPGTPRLARAPLPSDWGWGDGLALFALAVFTIFAATLWAMTPDFVYHWGIKGHRFFLAQGVDYAYLAAPWNWVIHPDYPNLLPELFAVTSLLRGGFRAEAVSLLSPLSLALALGSTREALARAGLGRFFAQATLALVAVTLAFFGLANLMAGGADGLVTLALLAAVPPLLRPVDPEGDLALGLAAAFAAAAKVEGVPLAGFLVLVALGRRLGWRALLHRLPRLAGPTALVVLPWLARVYHHHLFQEFNAGTVASHRAAAVAGTLAETLSFASPWHGFALSLFLVPLLAIPRRTRALAAVVALQLAFYLYVFFSARVDTVLLIRSSFPRLVMHLLPAVLVAAGVALGREEGTEQGGEAPRGG